MRLARARRAGFGFGFRGEIGVNVAGNAPFSAPVVPLFDARRRAVEIIVVHTLRGETRRPVGNGGLNFFVGHNVLSDSHFRSLEDFGSVRGCATLPVPRTVLPYP